VRPRLVLFRTAPAAVLATLAASGVPAAGTAPDTGAKGPYLTVVAVGDTGERNLDLFRNAMGINAVVHADPKRHALVFLGDNFYEQGVADETDRVRDLKFKQVYGSWFAESFGELEMKTGRSEPPPPAAADKGAADKAAAGETPPPPGRVHAVAGNHDYYSKEASREVLHALPVGFTTAGNAYEKSRKEWVYHYGDPEDVEWRIEGASSGRTRIHLFFLDTTLLVRSDWTVKTESCPSVPDPRDDAERLSCGYRAHVRERLIELLAGSRDEEGRDDVWRVLVSHHPLDTVGYHAGAQWMPDRGGVVRLNPCSKAEQPIGWLKNAIDPEDLCTEAWGHYIAFVREAIAKSGVKVHVALAGHDHSLQLLALDPARFGAEGPGTQIVAGAGSKTTAVDEPRPEAGRYTAFRPEAKARGLSESGWAKLRFSPEHVLVQFFSGRKEITTRMGRSEPLCLDANGKLMAPDDPSTKECR
jgi:hypothetical protein